MRELSEYERFLVKDIREHGRPYPCDVCGQSKCAPLVHVESGLTDEQALMFSRNILSDYTSPRAEMLARYILRKFDV